MTVVLDDERKLCRVEEILELTPIPGADLIELARVAGWHVVVKKGEYEVGDHAFYFEVDAAIPIDSIPELAFLADRGVVEEGGVRYHRVRTIRMRGVYSQGILVPLRGSSLQDRLLEWGDTQGQPFHTWLGVGKYEAASRVRFVAGDAVGPFPRHIQRTDSERVQNLSEEFYRTHVHPGHWVATEKVDGTSCTAWRDDEGDLHVASRNLERKDSEGSVYWGAVRAYGLGDLLRPGGWIQFEIAGPGVQANPLDLPGVRVFLFAASGVRDTDRVRELWAPEVDLGPLPVDRGDLVRMVDGLRSVINPKRLAEGLVFRSPVAYPELGYRHTFKVISNKYLLKGE